jgi:pentatricopeptide repeat protein
MSVTLVQEIGSIFMDVQTELVFFLLAVATHFLFFHKLRPAPRVKSMKEDPASPSNKQQSPKGAVSNSSLVSLRAALKAGDLKAVMTNFEALQGLWQKQESPSSAPAMLMEQIVKLAAQNGALLDFIQLLSRLELMDTTLEFVLAYCVDQGDTVLLKKVEQIGRQQGVSLSSAAYQALIKGASNRGDEAEAKRLMAAAREARVADIPAYNVYINALLKRGSIQEVRKAMESMRADGLRPNVVAFNKLLGSAVSLDVSNVWSIVDEMKIFGVKPDQVTCSILLKSRFVNSKASNIERVIAILDDMDGEMDEVLFNSVVDACVRVGRADLLMPFLKKQRSEKRAAVKGAHTYGSIIRAYGYVQDIRGAWDTWNEMRRMHIKPISVTLGCMVEALVTNGDVDGAYELIQEMKKDEETASLVNAVMYGSIVKGLSHKKCFGRMWEVYDEMIAQKLQFSMVTYNTLIDACARSGELSRISGLLKDMKAQDLKMGIVTYSAILKGYCQKNLLDEALELFNDMLTSGIEPDEIVFNTLLDGCARQGLYERGMKLFQRMKDSGVKPSNYTLSVLVKLANRGKKLDRAFQICDELTSQYSFRLNVHVFANLVQACTQHNQLRRGIDTLERMVQERVRPDTRTYSLLLKSCIENREGKQAEGLLRAAMGLSGVHPQLEAFSKSALQAQGGLPGDLVSEILQGLMDDCREEKATAALLVELAKVPGVKLDPKLRLRLLVRKGNAY